MTSDLEAERDEARQLVEQLLQQWPTEARPRPLAVEMAVAAWQAQRTATWSVHDEDDGDTE